MRLGPMDRLADPTKPPDPYPGKTVFACPQKFANGLSLASSARQKTVWEHYNEMSRYIDFDREREWGDVADSTLVFVSESVLYVH